MTRQPVLETVEAAVARVQDGMTVGIGGSVTANHPMALVRALARRGVRDLTVVAPTSGGEVDLLIAAGCVRRVLSAYVGMEVAAGVGPVFRRAVEAGEVEVVDLDEGHCVMGLRAAGHRLPSMPWQGGVGTALPELSPEWFRAFDDPVSGRPLLAVAAIELDVAFLYAETADAFGNTQPVATSYMDELLGGAARHVVVQTERIVSTEEVRRHPERTLFWPGGTVVRAPFGTHPYSNAATTADEAHLRGFAAAARAGEAELAAWMDRHVHGPADHEAYLETIGVRRLVSLLV